MPSFSPVSGSAVSFAPPPSASTAGSVTFAGYSLSTSKILLNGRNFEDSGRAEIKQYALPRRDGMGFVSRFWRKKTVTLEGTLVCESRSELESLMDEIKKSCYAPSSSLRYVDSNGTREITASLVSASFKREHYNLSWVPFVLVFESDDAFWRDVSNGSYSFGGITETDRVESLDSYGTAPAMLRAYFLFGSATSVTEVSVSANGKTATVSGAFSAGTLVVIDGEAKTVTVDGVETDYDGTFPEILPGPNSVTFHADGTHSYDAVAVFRKNYL